MEHEFVAYPSPWRRALLTAMALAFVVMGLWTIGAFGPPPSSNRYSPSETVAVGWASVLFFSFCTIVGFIKIFDRAEQLRINSEGIRYTPWSAKTIPWSDIIDVTCWTYGRQKAIILHLQDAALYPRKGALGFLNSANRKLTGGDIAISLTGTDRRFSEAMAAIERHRQGPVARG